ncbi:MAG TPA: NfeD family protein [Acidimicrobiales bacterium]|nr:NfeD family protein [Acidimicrobiales bacterium]
MVDVIEVNGLIDPVTADFIARAVGEAERSTPPSAAVVLQLDSPGVALSPARLRTLLSWLGESTVPVTVWVGPSGAQAGGGSVALARVAAAVGRAPGARLPGGVRGAVDLGVAPTIGDFIVHLDGRRLGDTTLHTAKVIRGGAQPRRQPTVAVRFAKPTMMGRLMHTAASPSVAYLLLLVGLTLVVFELFTAGVGVAAAVAAVCLVLAGYGLDVLDVRWWALALLGLGVGGFAIDVQAGVPRTWSVIGTVALLGGTIGFSAHHRPSVLSMVFGCVGVALAMVAGMPSMVRARFSTPTIGRESMVGETGRAVAPVAPDGTVEVRGAPWRARTNRATPIPSGDPVRVVAIDGLVLEVEPLEGAAKDAHH